MIEFTRFKGFEAGPHLVVFGAIHGDEHCGATAIRRLVRAFQQGQLKLEKGTLTCVPIANPPAFEAKVRFCARNLNRAFYPRPEPKSNEDHVNNILCELIAEGDVLIDLHSYASPGGLFGFIGHSSEAEIDLCLHLGVQNFVYGWSEAYAKVQPDTRESMGTVEYARIQGLMATTIECAQHDHPEAADNGYRVLIAGLRYLGLIAGEPVVTENQQFVQMQSVVIKAYEGQFCRPWTHLDAVQVNEPIAQYESGEIVCAPDDGFIVLPKAFAAVGQEWFYFGRGTRCPDPKN